MCQVLPPVPGSRTRWCPSSEQRRREVTRGGLGAKFEWSSDIHVVISRREYRSCSCGAQELYLAGRQRLIGEFRVQIAVGAVGLRGISDRACGVREEPKTVPETPTHNSTERKEGPRRRWCSCKQGRRQEGGVMRRKEGRSFRKQGRGNQSHQVKKKGPES